MKFNPKTRLAEISETAEKDGSAVVCGYLIGASSWGLITEEDRNMLRGDHRVEWKDYEIRDDPFFPDVSVQSDATLRERETELIMAEDYSDLDATWTDHVSGLLDVNRKEIRVELALGLRGKLQDYAGCN